MKNKRMKKWWFLPLVAIAMIVVVFTFGDIKSFGKTKDSKETELTQTAEKHTGKPPVNITFENVENIVIEKEDPLQEEIKEEDVDTEEELEVPVEQKVVYLTFDDGPHPVTEELLTILKEYDAKATFFMLEPQIQKHKETVQRIAEEGHALALHGVSHNKQQFYASQYSVINEMTITQHTVKEITGVETVLIRTPFGSSPHMTPLYKEAVKTAGFILWDWNVDSRDWQFKGPEYIVHTLLQVEEVVKRGEEPVILLHDLVSTVEHLTVLLDELNDMGFVFKAIEEGMEPIELK